MATLGNATFYLQETLKIVACKYITSSTETKQKQRQRHMVWIKFHDLLQENVGFCIHYSLPRGYFGSWGVL